MSSLLDTLKKQSSVLNMSVGDLVIDRRYRIVWFSVRETKFGRAVLCRVNDEVDNKIIECFLPKTISLSEEDVIAYNERASGADMFLIFLGKRGRAFNITFE